MPKKPPTLTVRFFGRIFEAAAEGELSIFAVIILAAMVLAVAIILA